MTTRTHFSLALISAALLSACASVPTPNAHLTQARNDMQAAQNDPRTVRLAVAELQQAQTALNTANAAWERQDKPEDIDHLAYIARQRVAIARETAALRTAEQTAGTAGSTRSNIQLQARTQEADSARRMAEQSQRDAKSAQTSADRAWAETAEAQRQSDVTQLQNRALQERLRELNAKSSPRGIVLTLGDVLFDTDKAQLKPDGLRMVRQLVAVLNEYPAYNALVEGFTDSTGTEAHNLALSGKRADAVRAALLGDGIPPSRVTTRDHGENNPVSSNDTADGRQLNRRVEILLSDGRSAISTR